VLHLLAKELKVPHILSHDESGAVAQGTSVLRRQAAAPTPSGGCAAATAKGTFDEVGQGGTGHR